MAGATEGRSCKGRLTTDNCNRFAVQGRCRMAVTFTVDGSRLEVHDGGSSLQPALGQGMYFPDLSFHPDLSPSGEKTPVQWVFRGESVFADARSSGEEEGRQLCAVEVDSGDALLGSPCRGAVKGYGQGPGTARGEGSDALRGAAEKKCLTTLGMPAKMRLIAKIVVEILLLGGQARRNHPYRTVERGMALKSIKIRKLGIEDPEEMLHIQDILTGKKIATEETSY